MITSSVCSMYYVVHVCIHICSCECSTYYVVIVVMQKYAQVACMHYFYTVHMDDSHTLLKGLFMRYSGNCILLGNWCF